MAKKFDRVIEILEQIIEHWFDKEKLFSILRYKGGLCLNLAHPEDDDYLLTHGALFDCIRDYNTKHNKIEYTGIVSIFYPVELSHTAYYSGATQGTLFHNPKRFHLAVFMLAWFRQHNVEDVSSDNKSN
jgi:hypothetical protein